MSESKNIVKQLLAAKKAYYIGKPLMSDDAFDTLEDELRDLDPDNAYFQIVGAEEGNSKTKVKHEIHMLSAGKGKTPEDIYDWAEKMGISKDENLLTQPKIDGLSGNCVYENGKLVLVATRGDGKIGQDISHVAKYVDIPKSIKVKGRVEVRGEFYLPKNNPVTKIKLRNNAVGLINRKDHGLEDLKHVKFVAYQVYGIDYISENEKIDWLKTSGFNIVWKKPIYIEDVASLYDEYLKTLRNKWEYETDGLIIVVDDNRKWNAIDAKREVEHHHHYMIALKPPSEGKETILKGIEWNVSRQGKLIPVALLEPIELGGATVQRCTLNNYENVYNLKLHKGDKVVIERANDVIPFFKANLTEHKVFSPSICADHCTSCGAKTKIEGIHLVCNNPDCIEQAILKVVHWVKACEMEFFSESSVRALFAAKKIKNIGDLYKLTEKDMRGLDSFGSSRIANALKQIEDTKEMNIGQFVDRLGIDLVGEKACKKMGIKTEADLWAFSDKTFVIGQNLIEYLNDNKAFVKYLLSQVKITEIKEVSKGAKRVCMTGAGPKKRDELIADIAAKGDCFVDHVNKETDVLLCEDKNSGTSKLAKAAKMGVKIMNYDEYFT